MKIINIVETVGNKISQIIPYLIHDDKKTDEVNEMVELEYIKLINEHIYPVVLSDESQEHWLKQKIYHNGEYRLEIVISHTN